jgi:branched-chain amino acid transport system ATP-binding protein
LKGIRPIIETDGLTVMFGGVTALKNVDFSLTEGELRCLIGPNGAGKSTFFKCLTQQYRASAGKIFFEGKNITHTTTSDIARRGIALKTQTPSLFERLTVRENIWLAASRRHNTNGADRATNETLEQMELTSLSNELVERLSHGQRQWVEIAMVVTSKPTLILLDEPTAGMTQDEVTRTVRLILELNRSTSLIVVEHDMQFVRSLASTVTVFNQGQILIEDSAEVVLCDSRVRNVYLGK